MSKLADEIIEKLFTDWKGNKVPRLIQADTNGCGWGEHAVRAIIEAAEQSVHPTLLESPREQTRCDCASCQQELSELPQSG